MLTFRSPGSTRLQLQAWLATLPVPVGQTVQAASPLSAARTALGKQATAESVSE